MRYAIMALLVTFPSGAFAQEIGVPGVFNFQGPIRSERTYGDQGYYTQQRQYRHRHHCRRVWDEDEGEWQRVCS